MNKTVSFITILAAAVAFADDGFMNQPSGIKIGQRMTLRPYVAMSYSYDSNVDSSSRSGGGHSFWTINPGLDLEYAGGNWKLSGQAYYNYHAFSDGPVSELNNDSYGEQLTYSWSNISNGGAGWSLLLSERYVRANQNDDLRHNDGRGLWRDRQQFDATASLQRRFNEHWHLSANGGYYWLDYANQRDAFAPLYGWNRWTAGAQFGFTASKWTDLFVAGSYQGYEQNCEEATGVGRTSDGWTVHLGIGSYMTDRISYRVSGGVSTFNYGYNAASDTGFTYQGSLRWMIGETWMTTLLFSSHYQPSEREYASAVRCDAVSWGLAKSLIRGKVNTTFDVSYRRDTHVHSGTGNDDWNLNLITARLGVNYTVNRLLTVFARGEYQNELNDGDRDRSGFDYDRWRVTAGLKFTY